MIEIAICLAIIGIALVAIIGVLPMGLNVQKDNREETIINQDATVFMEYIRNGARGADDLTNYIFAITNFQTRYNPAPGPGPTTFGYNYSTIPFAINNGTNIIGLLSTPEYVDASGFPINNLFSGGYSNHIVACVRSISGPASEKPPQDNSGTVRGDSFSYKIVCENTPVAVYTPPLWQAQPYNAGDYVSYTLNGQTTYWRANAPTLAANEPSLSPLWARILYPQQLTANLHELRLTFLWPLLPNGKTGNGRQTFRTTVAGQIVTNIDAGQILYFFQPQSFISAP
jgi:type II secretory pathway pseudopilin PulG